MTDPCVLVLAKAPRPGMVKTRLSPPCTPEQCAHIAEAAVRDTLQAALATGRRVVLALDGPRGAWLPDGIDVVDQQGIDLTARLQHAWSCIDGPAVQIGMDTPQVSARDLDDALQALDRAPSALGLAFDGGWWALALRRPQPEVFSGIATSRSDTGLRQWARLVALGLAPVALATRTDVDDWPSALAVADAAPTSAAAAAIRQVARTLDAA